jgi:hypothetical protein
MRNFKRLAALIDQSAWLLMLPAAFFLWLADPAMMKTLLQWTSFALVIAGACVIISRVIFPHIELTELVERAVDSRNVAAGIVASAIILFVGILIHSLIYWAKT